VWWSDAEDAQLEDLHGGAAGDVAAVDWGDESGALEGGQGVFDVGLVADVGVFAHVRLSLS
jgi:hypothetical protein